MGDSLGSAFGASQLHEVVYSTEVRRPTWKVFGLVSGLSFREKHLIPMDPTPDDHREEGLTHGQFIVDPAKHTLQGGQQAVYNVAVTFENLSPCTTMTCAVR